MIANELVEILEGHSSGQGRGEATSFQNTSPINNNRLCDKIAHPALINHLGSPLIIENPIQFRNDLQALVMTTMVMKADDDDEKMKDILKNGSLIEVATAVQLRKAATGDLKAYQYIMDRVLGKPINQTNTVNMNITYEQFLDNITDDDTNGVKQIASKDVNEEAITNT